MLCKLREFTLLLAAVTMLSSGCGKDTPKTAKKAPKVKRSKGKKVASKRKKPENKKAAEKGQDSGAKAKLARAADAPKAAKKASATAPAPKPEAPERPTGAKAPASEGEAAPVAGALDPAVVAENAGAPPPEAAEAAAAKAGSGAAPAATEAASADSGGAEQPPAAPKQAEPEAQPAAPANPAMPEAEAPQPPAAGVLPKVAPKGAPPPVVLDKPIKRPDPPLDITGYLVAADLERVFGKRHKFRRSDLEGVKPTKTYNSTYYSSTKDKRFGVSLQVWRDGSLVDSRTRFNTMRNTYTDVVATDKVTEQGFRAHFGGVVTLVFADPRKPLIAAVSCSVKICNPDAIIMLSRRVAERLR